MDPSPACFLLPLSPKSPSFIIYRPGRPPPRETTVLFAIAGMGIVALPGYVAREDVRSGALRRVLPAWLAGDSTITALIPYRQGLLPSVRVFIDHLAAGFPKAVFM
jgi:DNA-binding transcriptional LysR family regulator